MAVKAVAGTSSRRTGAVDDHRHLAPGLPHVGDGAPGHAAPSPHHHEQPIIEEVVGLEALEQITDDIIQAHHARSVGASVLPGDRVDEVGRVRVVPHQRVAGLAEV